MFAERFKPERTLLKFLQNNMKLSQTVSLAPRMFRLTVISRNRRSRAQQLLR